MNSKPVKVVRFSLIKNELEKIVNCDEKSPEDRIKATKLMYSLRRIKLLYYLALLISSIVFILFFVNFLSFAKEGGTVSVSILNSGNRVSEFIFLGNVNPVSTFLSVAFSGLLTTFCVWFGVCLKEKIINIFFNKIKPDQLIHTNFQKIKDQSTVNFSGGIFVLDMFIALFD